MVDGENKSPYKRYLPTEMVSGC